MGYFEENLHKVISDENRDLCQVFGDKEGAHCSVALVKIYKNGIDTRHYHDNITEIYVFSKGEGIININGNENYFKNGDCYIISPHNTHFVVAKSDLEFVCICTPPWTEEHEFIVTEKEKQNTNIEKYNGYGSLLSLSEKENHDVSLRRLSRNEEFEPELYKSDFTRVYYFIEGSGEIKIGEKVHSIEPGECVKVEPNEKEKVISKDELTFVTVYDILKR